MEGRELAKKDMALTAMDVRKQVNLIQEIMKSVMKDGEHYGKIPGCDKPALLKPGAEKLTMTFRLSPKYEELPGSVESDAFICYKINCELIHIPTGQTYGNGRGTCNSKEKKYRTRSVYANKATDEEKAVGKMEKRKGRDGSSYDVYIIPQDPWDVQNTIYKMACKRALIAAVLNATAASDIFTQDIEDIPEGTVLEDAETGMARTVKPTVYMPQEKKQKPEATNETGSAQDVFKDAEPPVKNCLDVLTALKKPVGETFNVWGILFEHKTRQVNTKNGSSDITGYRISPRGSAELIEISIWELPVEGVANDDVLAFTDVKVGEYKGKKQYNAKAVEIIEKGQAHAEPRD